ncbi:MAG: glycine oxidase ThiO [Acidobacteriaceae bacterium]
MKSWDVIIVGGGIIGLSLSIALRKNGLRVLIVERGHPGREASHAAAGMLASAAFDSLSPLRALARASAEMYPEFVHELQDESGIHIDLRDKGTLDFSSTHGIDGEAEVVSLNELADLEPSLPETLGTAHYLSERSVDSRHLVSAALKTAKHRGVDISSGTTVVEVLVADGSTRGVRTEKTSYASPTVVNCSGAWAGQFSPVAFPIRPVKGQVLSVIGGPKIDHVLIFTDVYLVPRSDGRLLIGASLEEAGYDKRLDADVIKRLHQAAVSAIPALAGGKILEMWAGLRPGTPDNLPALGATTVPGYFIASGHFRDGILLAPITAKVMAELIGGEKTECDLAAFSPMRFFKQ